MSVGEEKTSIEGTTLFRQRVIEKKRIIAGEAVRPSSEEMKALNLDPIRRRETLGGGGATAVIDDTKSERLIDFKRSA